MDKVLTDLNKKYKREEFKKSLPWRIKWVLNSIPTYTIAILLNSTSPAYSEEIDILTWCVQIEDARDWNVLICDDPLFKRYNDILNEGGSKVVNVVWFSNFLNVYWPVLEYLYPAWIDDADIISAMNLYEAESSKDIDYIGYTLRYLDFVSWYPNPDLQLEDFLWERGVFLYD